MRHSGWIIHTFQFQQVRLREETRRHLQRCLACFNSNRYDWEPTQVSIYRAALMFQFQQVRLREFPVPRPDGINCVSIPTGTIESPRPESGKVGIAEFQFQQVRLRASLSRWKYSKPPSFNSNRYDWERERLLQICFGISRFNSNRYDWEQCQRMRVQPRYIVSIPTGTIERPSPGQVWWVNSVFQFQQVRLRARMKYP